MIRVFVENAHSRYRVSSRETAATARAVLESEGSRYRWVSIVFVTDAYSRKLNKKYLSHDYPTDVLAFRLEETEPLEGEIYVNLDRARTQARHYGVSFMNEVGRLVIHGLLHLVGYRDSTVLLKKKMRQKEDEYLESCWAKNGHARKSN